MTDALLSQLQAEGYSEQDAKAMVVDLITLHNQRQAQAAVAETAHVHDVAHSPVITTEPLAHLKEDVKKDADLLVLQSRHVAMPFGTLTIGEGKAQETVTVVGIMPRWSAPFPEGPPVREVVASLVTIKGTTQHSHQAGTPVSAPGMDPESVDASGVVCHDCGQALIRDKGDFAPLICPRLHGIRPRDLTPKREDGAVECGLASLSRTA